MISLSLHICVCVLIHNVYIAYDIFKYLSNTQCQLILYNELPNLLHSSLRLIQYLTLCLYKTETISTKINYCQDNLHLCHLKICGNTYCYCSLMMNSNITLLFIYEQYNIRNMYNICYYSLIMLTVFNKKLLLIRLDLTYLNTM